MLQSGQHISDFWGLIRKLFAAIALWEFTLCEQASLLSIVPGMNSGKCKIHCDTKGKWAVCFCRHQDGSKPEVGVKEIVLH
jgi:hypothetical protein